MLSVFICVVWFFNLIYVFLSVCMLYSAIAYICVVWKVDLGVVASASAELEPFDAIRGKRGNLFIPETFVFKTKWGFPYHSYHSCHNITMNQQQPSSQVQHPRPGWMTGKYFGRPAALHWEERGGRWGKQGRSVIWYKIRYGWIWFGWPA